MQVILTQDIPKLGKKNQLVNVKPGYYRNFLDPKGLAVAATASLLIKAQEVEAQIAKENAEKKQHAVEIFNKLNGKTLVVASKLNKKGKLYSKVSKEMVLAAIDKDFSINLGPDTLKFDQNIKEEGAYDLIINLGFDQVAQGKIKVNGLTE